MSDVAAPDKSSPHFDDRLDTHTRITNLEVAGILWRALKLVSTARRLFLSKIGLGFIALIPGLYISWLTKIVIDQVLLQKPFDQTEVPYSASCGALCRCHCGSLAPGHHGGGHVRSLRNAHPL